MLDVIENIFSSAQYSSACHLKNAQILKKLFENDETDTTFLELFTYIRYTFYQRPVEKNVYVERVLCFIATFCACFKTKDEHSTLHGLVIRVIHNLLDLCELDHEPFRFWACRALVEIFKQFEELTDELYQRIAQVMIERLNESKASIRQQAILVLAPLQDPHDKEDPIINSFLAIINVDYNAKIRQLLIEKIARTCTVLPYLLNGVRDVNENVRLTAFSRLETVIKYLLVAERQTVLESAFQEESSKVRCYIRSKFLPAWLTTYENNFLALMKGIRFDACEEDVEKTVSLNEKLLSALFEYTPVEDILKFIEINENKLIDFENVNWESLLFYRIAVDFFRRSQAFVEVLERILPELVIFCQYIKEYFQHKRDDENLDVLQYNFTLQQFFLITRGYDVSDSASRHSLNSLIRSMLQNGNSSIRVIQTILQNLEKTLPKPNGRTLFVCEIISNIIYGDKDVEEITKQAKLKSESILQLKSDILSLKELEEKCVNERNFLQAEQCRLQLQEKTIKLENLSTEVEQPELEKRTDFITLLNALNLAIGLLKCSSITKTTPSLLTLNTELIVNCLTNDDIIIKIKAFECYALYCLLDSASAKYGIHIFSVVVFSAGDVDRRLLVICMKILTDLLCTYGLDLVEKQGENETSDSMQEEQKKVFVGGTSLTDLLQSLVDLLNHDEREVEETATKCICSLLLCSSITSSSLLSTVIVKWLNPITDNDLKQFIAYTLFELPQLPQTLLYFADAVITTVKVVSGAPFASPLAEVDITQIFKFMVAFCSMSSQGPNIIEDLALKICNIYKSPRSKRSPYYLKLLFMLEIPQNGKHRDELKEACELLQKKIRDKSLLKGFIKFSAQFKLDEEP